MQLGNYLRRVGAASPMVPALVCGVVAVVANVLAGLAEDSVALSVVVVLAWLAAALFLFVVVTWYRDDDWLAAGFLIGLTLILSAFVSDVATRTLASGGIADAVFTSAGASMGLFLRAIIFVPLCGGLVSLARWITRVVRASS